MDGMSYDKTFVEYMRVGQDKRVMRYLSPDYSDDPWCSESNSELYRSVYKFYGSSLESCPISGPLFFDLDGDLRTRRNYKELKRSVRAVINWFKQWELTEQEIEIYFSGSKGFHVVIPEKVLDIKPSVDLNKIILNSFLIQPKVLTEFFYKLCCTIVKKIKSYHNVLLRF